MRKQARVTFDVGSVDGDTVSPMDRPLKRLAPDGREQSLRIKRKRKPDPPPRKPFRDVVTKGLVDEAEARALWDTYADRVGTD